MSIELLEGLKEVFNNEYEKSKFARFDYEVFNGKRSFRGLVELEAALHHIGLSLGDGVGDKSFELESARNHLQRIAIDLTEEVAETLCLIIREKLDPFLKHPFMCKTLFLRRPDRMDNYWECLRRNEQLIREGRKLKGEKEKFDRCYQCFKTALEELWELNAKAPYSLFKSHLFTVLVAAISIIIGFLLSLLIK